MRTDKVVGGIFQSDVLSQEIFGTVHAEQETALHFHPIPVAYFTFFAVLTPDIGSLWHDSCAICKGVSDPEWGPVNRAEKSFAMIPLQPENHANRLRSPL